MNFPHRYDRNKIALSEEECAALADKRIVVEIETGVTPLTASELYHAVARVFVNPFVGHGLSTRLHHGHLLGHDCSGEEKQQNSN